MSHLAVVRPALRLIPSERELLVPVRFCGYCGVHSPQESEPGQRICGDCGLGMVLSAPRVVAPQPGEPALVIDRTLAVCAVNRHAEDLLGIDEPQAINSHIGRFLVPAHAEAPSLDGLVAQVVSAAGGAALTERAVVRPTGEFGIRYAVRIGACGPPSAALVVLDDDEV